MNLSRIFFVLVFYIISSSHLKANTLEKHILKRPDGSSLIYYFDKSCVVGQFSILALLQGSEMESPSSILADFFSNEELKSINAALLLVEKPGIDGNEIDKAMYLKKNTITQRINDFKQVLEHIQKQEFNWDQCLYISGISEGGMLVPKLGRLVPQSKALIIFCGGCGMSLKEELITLIQKKYYKAGLSNWFMKHLEISNIHISLYLTKIFSTSIMTCLGETNSFIWWNEIANLNPSNDLIEIEIPIYLSHGTSDINCPIESADKLAAIFETLGKNNLTYERYDDYDHGFTDSLGNHHWNEVIHSSVEWLKKIKSR